MSKARNLIISEKKALILAEMEVPGCVVLDLVKFHNVSKSTIYKWWHKANNLKINNKAPDAMPGFVEVSVKPAPQLPSSLTSASLKFNNFSVVIEGEAGSKVLLSLLKLLEQQSC